LKVSYGGTKSWFVTTYRNGKAHTHKLGVYPAMSLKAANEAARSYYQDPDTYKAKAEVGSFHEVAELWLKRHVEEKQLRTAREMKRHLAFYVYPQLKKDTRFLEIRRKQINELLDTIADKHGKSQADAVLGTLSNLMNWYQ